jgi:hypothetical protein
LVRISSERVSSILEEAISRELKIISSINYRILINVGLATSGLDTLLLSLGQLLDVAIEGILFGSGGGQSFSSIESN